MHGERYELAMMVFNAIDENDDQMISENELREAHSLMMKYGKMADLAHGGTMEGIDTNHDGKIDLSEFKAMMLEHEGKSKRYMNKRGSQRVVER